ncbi:magnesium transporter [Janibacter cremeus]|uniref:Magnesium transporter MgtE n=1 Tax=Janibacter cremeus TaxID=1285192 RepID=A0A852VI07_9MICO|nr:magnesium transporter [Janibacter cremeus]NYF96737.1 magnesium transporter [Janibacter cremeus]
MRVDIDMDRVRTLIQSRDLSTLSLLVRQMSPAEIVASIESATSEDAAVIFRLLDKDVAVVVFDDLDTVAQADLINRLGHAPLTDVFANLDPDEQARLLDELPAKVAKRLLASFDGDELDATMELLGYPQGSVGRQMSSVAVHARPDARVGEVLGRVNRHPGDIDQLTVIPVISHDRIVLGTIDTIELMRHPSDAMVIDLMDDDPQMAGTEDNAERISRRLLDSGLLMVPVVDRERRLVGVLPITDAARIDKEAVAEDHARAGASEPLRRPYLATPVRVVARSRIVWLFVLAISAVLTVQVLEMFEATLTQLTALALFIPLVTGIGGNTGSQAATTVTRAMALGDIRIRDVVRVAFKEVRTGLTLGLLLAIAAFVLGSPFYGMDIGLVIALTLFLNCPIAATVGGVVPLVARYFRVDPAVFSTPFISTFCDASGLLVYFTVAITLLGL